MHSLTIKWWHNIATTELFPWKLWARESWALTISQSLFYFIVALSTKWRLSLDEWHSSAPSVTSSTAVSLSCRCWVEAPRWPTSATRGRPRRPARRLRLPASDRELGSSALGSSAATSAATDCRLRNTRRALPRHLHTTVNTQHSQIVVCTTIPYCY